MKEFVSRLEPVNLFVVSFQHFGFFSFFRKKTCRTRGAQTQNEILRGYVSHFFENPFSYKNFFKKLFVQNVLWSSNIFF